MHILRNELDREITSPAEVAGSEQVCYRKMDMKNGSGTVQQSVCSPPDEKGLAYNFSLPGLSVESVINAVAVPCFLIDENGQFVCANHLFYDLVNDQPESYKGRDPYCLLAPRHAEQVRNIDKQLIATGGIASHEIEISGSDGAPSQVVMKKSLLSDEDGGIIGILVALLEFSELNAIKTALQVSESEKQAILEGFPGILCLFDTNERLIWANEKVRELSAAPIGKTCHELFCRKCQPCQSCAVPKSLLTGKSQSTIQQFEVQTCSGEERVYELTGTPVRDNHGIIVSVVVIGRDITEKNRLEKQLRHTQKMEAIGTLAGGIAHDFNNVLTPIMGYSEIIRLKLMRDANADEMVLEYLDGILRAAKRAKSLVEQILTFSRASEQKESLQHIQPVVKEALKLMRVTLPSTITIEEDIEAQCGIVSVDPVQIHQILINLCTNSAHAMAGNHGTLTVKLERDRVDSNGQGWLKLTVADTGCGIPPETLDRIFEPYFTTKEKSRGTGMGLALVHGIINRMGGRIEVESEVGVGTSFEIFLPVSRKRTRIDQVVNTSDLVRGEGHILLVDDEAQVVQVTGELLTSIGYTVTGCTSPFEAVKQFSRSSGQFDLLLTDLTMPELTGIELSRAIKEIRNDLPVVLFTGCSDQLSREEAEQSGINMYCMKPVSLRDLSKMLHKCLHKRPEV